MAIEMSFTRLLSEGLWRVLGLPIAWARKPQMHSSRPGGPGGSDNPEQIPLVTVSLVPFLLEGKKSISWK